MRLYVQSYVYEIWLSMMKYVHCKHLSEYHIYNLKYPDVLLRLLVYTLILPHVHHSS